MRKYVLRSPSGLLIGAASVLSLPTLNSVTLAGTLRIGAWNIEADINGTTTPLPGFNTVLQGMGSEILGGVAQPLDILSLEETTSNNVTVAPVVTDLNGDYGAGTYAASPYQATDSGGTNAGNGPNALVYNTKTVTLLQSYGVGTPTGSNGEYRQVVRYEFEAVGSTSPFYVYVSHMKSGSTGQDAIDRGNEANIIRADEKTLPTTASIIVMGDLNADPTQKNETQFSIFGAAGQGSVTDPLNYPGTINEYTESSKDLRYRDDYQLLTSNVINGTGAINYVNGTLNTLGNNGTTGDQDSVYSPSTTGGSNTALAYMTGGTYGTGNTPTQSQVLYALTTASDHMPILADYSFSVPEPTAFSLFIAAGLLLPIRRRRD